MPRSFGIFRIKICLFFIFCFWTARASAPDATGAKRVDLENLRELGSLDIFHQRVGLHYAGVGDDVVETADPERLLKLLHDFEGVSLARGNVLDHNQTATFALGQVALPGSRLAAMTVCCGI